MGCSSCSSGTKDDKHPGCKSNGGCATDGCSKLSTFNWLAGMQSPDMGGQYDVCELRFKSGRKVFYRNIHDIQVQIGDVVVVESSPGYDVGVISAEGELARIQSEKKAPGLKKFELKKIMRKATAEDIALWQKARMREPETMLRSREISRELNLVMKISDVEYQGDNSKAVFFYTAEDRVDFRELIKHLAEQFKVRVEMRQIGARQEASRLGGIGSCGRELCCSTWLTDFRTVSTSAARYQQLSLNPQKLAGQCGKLKCCLNYELDMYMEAIRDFPDPSVRLKSKDGLASHFKTDIFKRIVWYLVPTSNGTTPIPLQLSRVEEILAMNKEGKFPDNFKDYAHVVEVEVEPDYDNVVGQDSLTRFDKKPKGRRPAKNRNSGLPDGANTSSRDNRPEKKDVKANQGEAKKRPARTISDKPKATGNAVPGAEQSTGEKKPFNKRRRPNNRRKPEGGDQGPKNKE
ncbi:MAG: cell fate regulator YaaT (PSP1 superfamily) [Sphingobacteriales bacterium]|jgi:cell fate regulator YaaT (PSP1 superfamily)